MTAARQTRGIFDDRFDIHALTSQWTESGRQAVEQMLELYQESVGQLAETHVRTAQAFADPNLVTIAETQAALSRDVAEAYVTSVRKLLEL